MTRVLALDTTDERLRLAGVGEAGLVDPRDVEVDRRHDEHLAAELADWLTVQGRDWPEAVAVVVGPGPFTSLRVGVAAATGLAMALGLPVIPVSSYASLAARAPQGALVWALPYGGRRELRGRPMRGGDTPEPLAEGALEVASEATLPAGEERLIPLGAGWERHRQTLTERLGERLWSDAELLSPLEGLARAVRAAAARGEAVPATEVDVDYGADFVPTPKGGRPAR